MWQHTIAGVRGPCVPHLINDISFLDVMSLKPNVCAQRRESSSVRWSALLGSDLSAVNKTFACISNVRPLHKSIAG